MAIILLFLIVLPKIDPYGRGIMMSDLRLASPKIPLMVYTSPEFRFAHEFGLKRVMRGGNVYAGRLTIEDVRKLAGYPEVKYIHFSRKLNPLLNYNSEKTGFRTLRENPGLTGRGVIVGIVDTGIDLSHPDLVNDDGSVRVSFVWDQTVDGDPPDGFEYGTECDAYEINMGICKIDFKDTYGHGTHISGILLSDDKVYTGLITESIAVFVKTGYDENQVIDAVNYIFSIADRYSLPAVVNLSLGGHFGPHDGTSMFEEALSSLMGQGKIIVVSAGNDGNKNLHVGYPVNATEGIFLSIPSFFGFGGSAIMEFWYERSDYVDFKVVAVAEEGGNHYIVDSTQWVSPGNEGRFSLRSANAFIGESYIDATVDSYPISGKRYVYIEIKSYDPLIKWGIFQKPTYGEPSKGFVHGWLLSDFSVITSEEGHLQLMDGDNYITVHTHPGDSYYTVMVPATARNVIAVGSYVGRTSWNSMIGNYSEDITEGVISPFSSKGPSLNPSYTGIKPLITAPGQWVISTRSSYLSGIPSYRISDDGMHYSLDGTSVSAPFVTALAVLLLEKNPYLTPDEVSNIICESASRDDFTGELPSPEWGCGKLQPLSAINHVDERKVDAPLPAVLEVKKTKDGVFLRTDTLTQVSIIWDGGLSTDMSYSERHLIKGVDGGNIKIVVRDVFGRSFTMESYIEDGGCGCAEGGRESGVIEFVILFLTLRILVVKIFQLYASYRD